MANIGKFVKMGAGLVTAVVGGIVAFKAGKTADKETTDGNKVIEDEELKELAEMEAATEEESEPETVEAEEIEEDG